MGDVQTGLIAFALKMCPLYVMNDKVKAPRYSQNNSVLPLVVGCCVTHEHPQLFGGKLEENDKIKGWRVIKNIIYLRISTYANVHWPSVFLRGTSFSLVLPVYSHAL